MWDKSSTSCESLALYGCRGNGIDNLAQMIKVVSKDIGMSFWNREMCCISNKERERRWMQWDCSIHLMLMKDLSNLGY